MYLIHFAWPLGEPGPAATRSRASHYPGTAYDLRARLRQHGAGQGTAIMRAVGDRGIPWFLAQTWVGGRVLERSLKRRHNNPSLCPGLPDCLLGAARVDELKDAVDSAAELVLERELETGTSGGGSREPPTKPPRAADHRRSAGVGFMVAVLVDAERAGGPRRRGCVGHRLEDLAERLEA